MHRGGYYWLKWPCRHQPITSPGWLPKSGGQPTEFGLDGTGLLWNSNGHEAGTEAREQFGTAVVGSLHASAGQWLMVMPTARSTKYQIGH
jgi:hypothetical protein